MWHIYGVPTEWHSETILEMLHGTGFTQIGLQRKKRRTHRPVDIRLVAVGQGVCSWVVVQAPTSDGKLLDIDIVKEEARSEEMQALEIMAAANGEEPI